MQTQPVPFVSAKYGGKLNGSWTSLRFEVTQFILICNDKKEVVLLWDPDAEMNKFISGQKDRLQALAALDKRFFSDPQHRIYPLCRSISYVSTLMYCTNSNGNTLMKVADDSNKFVSYGDIKQTLDLESAERVMPNFSRFFRNKMVQCGSMIRINEDTQSLLLEDYFSGISNATIGKSNKKADKKSDTEKTSSKRVRPISSKAKTAQTKTETVKRSEKKKTKVLDESLMVKPDVVNGEPLRQQASVVYSAEDIKFLKHHGFDLKQAEALCVKTDTVVKISAKKVVDGNPRKLFPPKEMVFVMKGLNRNNIMRQTIVPSFQPSSENCEVFERDDHTFFYVPNYENVIKELYSKIWNEDDAVDAIFGAEGGNPYDKEKFFADLRDYFFKGDISGLKDQICEDFEQTFYLFSLLRNKKYKEAMAKGVTVSDILNRKGCVKTLLSTCGQSLRRMHVQDISFEKLIDCGATSSDFSKENITAKELLESGVTPEKLSFAGFTFEEIQKTGAETDNLVQDAFFAEEVDQHSEMDVSNNEFFKNLPGVNKVY